MEYNDYWTVEYKQGWRGWTDDRSGPDILYTRKQDALDWARKLLSIQPRVRLKHTVHEYEDVYPEEKK